MFSVFSARPNVPYFVVLLGFMSACGLATPHAAPAQGAEPDVLGTATPQPGWLGFTYAVAERGKRGGRCVDLKVEVDHVVANTPAARAGLRQGDGLVLLNGLAVTSRLLESVAIMLEPGDAVRLRIRRDGEIYDVDLVAAPERARSSTEESTA